MCEETKLGKFYQKYIAKWIPSYGPLPLAWCAIFNTIIYWGTQRLMANAKHYDLTSNLDRSIPFVKEWIILYVLFFAFSLINYILVSREDKETFFRFATADMLSRVICCIFFILLPTTNIRPEVTGHDFCSWLVRFIYASDAPTNIFPSIHCLVSWFCFIGVRKSRKIPGWYKGFSFVMAALICASTQFTKQHYMIDLVAGIFLAEFCWFVSKHTGMYRPVMKVFDKIGRKIFGVKHYDE